MRTILMALILGISVAAVSAPALAGDEEHERFLAPADRDTPQVNVGVVAGEDQPQAPAVQERYEKN